MKVAVLLESRRKNWQELEKLCAQIESRRSRTMAPASISRFATLYRAACADLALADAYQLPPNTVQYLHRLVGRSHNQLYRSRKFDFATWGRQLLVDVPRNVFHDGYVRFCFCLFWGVFLLSGFLALSPAVWPAYVDQLLGQEQIAALEEMYSNDAMFSGQSRRTGDDDTGMTGFYVWNNTGIGLKCFAYMLLIVPGIYITVYNAAVLGGCFGYMARPETIGRDNFFEFVTAHGPFELTAVALASGAGLRLGMSWVATCGQSRTSSMQQAGRRVMPVVGTMMLLFFMAALIEGFLSPSAVSYQIKASVAIISVCLLLYYFVYLGYSSGAGDATG